VKIFKFCLLLLILLQSVVNSISQNPNPSVKKEKELLQFSGVVLTHDSLTPVPFTSVTIKGTRRGTLCDYYGFFSLVAAKGDTIDFSCLGFKGTTYIIPDSLSGDRYSLIQILLPTNYQLQEISIYAFPSRDQFRQAFMNLKIPNDDYERAKLNLDQQIMMEQYAAMPMSSRENYTNFLQTQTARLYHNGQYPTYNLLNPLAWAKFIQAWKNGDFKNKTKQ
jgi:hypothetical protein